MKQATFFAVLATILSVFFIACAEDEDFSTNNQLKLTFSTEEVSFDTIFSELGSTTRQFKIYNRNNNSLVIQSIEVMNPEKSGFRINIDGEYGTDIKDVDILKKDSLYGFIQITAPSSDSDAPFVIRDSIKFAYNGNIQYLQLQAIGQDVYIWKGNKVISKDTVITNSKPILIYGAVEIKSNTTTTIKEGVTIFMEPSASIHVHGSLKIEGSTKSPVVIRGSRFDKMDNTIPYDNIPGQWDGLYFYSESYKNNLENLVVRNATKGMTFYASTTKEMKATLTNTIVQNTSEYGVLATNSKIDAVNCLFVNSRGASLELRGGEYSFLHCTIGNYFSWLTRKKEALVLDSESDVQNVTPTVYNFINSIISGSAKNELSFNNQGNTTSGYLFRNCIIKGTEAANSSFEDILWNADPLFQDLNKDRLYFYNFELQATSPAINKADKAYSVKYPLDLKGRPRLKDANPDIGCYEWIGE